MIPDATPVPDTTAWAAEHLRGLGWVVVAPVDPNEAIPEPQVGQVWTASNPRISSRMVVEIGPARGWGDPKCVHFLVMPRGQFLPEPRYLNTPGWRAWVRKHNARPLPTPTAGATP